MDKFTKISSMIIPLLTENIDTDQIIPASYLKVTDKSGLAEGLFSGWRYGPDGAPDPQFPLNRKTYRGAKILLAGNNFGCGSSREHAPWALMGWGFQVVISTEFADIFQNNALKNGLLPVTVTKTDHLTLVERITQDPTCLVTIDLEAQTVSLPDQTHFEFPIDGFSKTCLLEGIDQMGYLMRYRDAIESYEERTGRVLGLLR
jgi:3-isopropylmalate/(R)-2-methylmalate dehydratase small subunit